MRVAYFLDTNVLLYAAAGRADSPLKFAEALALVSEANFGISTQVLQEFFVNATSKATLDPMSFAEAIAWVERLDKQPCATVDRSLVKTAIAISQRYRINYWDGAILAAAERLGAEIVYTEDLNHGQRYGSVRVINPFV
jgi:predicted nucleic acid-binding protein